MIAFKVPESKEETKEGRNKKDVHIIENLCDYIDLEQPSIEKTVRLGARNPTKIRPVKITFKSVFDKRNILASLYKLEDASDAYRSIN